MIRSAPHSVEYDMVSNPLCRGTFVRRNQLSVIELSWSPFLMSIMTRHRHLVRFLTVSVMHVCSDTPSRNIHFCAVSICSDILGQFSRFCYFPSYLLTVLTYLLTYLLSEEHEEAAELIITIDIKHTIRTTRLESWESLPHRCSIRVLKS